MTVIVWLTKYWLGNYYIHFEILLDRSWLGVQSVGSITAIDFRVLTGRIHLTVSLSTLHIPQAGFIVKEITNAISHYYSINSSYFKMQLFFTFIN